jgi:2-isopropylmalate synthase
LFSEPRKTKATFTAFGMTKRAGRSASNDPGLQSLLQAKSKAICFVAKSWDYHVRVALGCTNDENLEAIRDSVQAAKAAGKEVLVDCEHFFDGYKANMDYALACAKTAYDAGARWVVLCDTNGGTMPPEVSEIVGAVTKVIPGDHLGIHAHNDTEQAVANSLAAVEAGVRQIQGTLNGIGERCGNANLISIIGTLCAKPHFKSRFETGIDESRLQELTTVSRGFDEMLNRSPHAQAPYVGKSAFATKAGIHASALVKEPETYEHVPPETVGNRRRVLVSDQAGKSNLIAELTRVGLNVDKTDARLDALLREVKEREAVGYAYDGADASFELLARRMLGGVPHFFDVLSFRTSVEQFNGDMHTEAVVKVKVGNDIYLNAGEGNGPVNALDVALRKDLGKYQKYIADMDLVDFKVRILNGGTGATTRVLIESRDGKGERWFTVGVSPNIVEASFQALLDAITFKLVRDGVVA